MFELARLAFPATEYAHLTFPRYRTCLVDSETSVAVGASLSGHPVGLALASIQRDCARAEIRSVAVAEGFRRRGLGTSLFIALSSEIAKECVSAEAVITEVSPYYFVVRQILESQGWNPVRPRMMICHSNLDSIFKAPWMHRNYLPPAFTVFPWADLRDCERRSIEARTCFPFPPILSPFRETEPFEPVSSLGLRYRDELAGWLITHLAHHDTLRVTSLVVRQDLERRARGISLLIEALARYKTKPIAQIAPKGIFNIHVDNVQMMQFAERRLAPYMTQIYYSHCASKIFRS